jgi:hypothetical protein
LKLKALQHFIRVVTPAALESPYVRREIRLARQEGKSICPVKGLGLGDLSKAPRWLGHIYDLEIPEQQTALIGVLQNESRQKRMPMMASEPPSDFVHRPKEFDALKRRLLNAKGDSVTAITAALRGAGGYGKTTLAKALPHDPTFRTPIPTASYGSKSAKSRAGCLRRSPTSSFCSLANGPGWRRGPAPTARRSARRSPPACRASDPPCASPAGSSEERARRRRPVTSQLLGRAG